MSESSSSTAYDPIKPRFSLRSAIAMLGFVQHGHGLEAGFDWIDDARMTARLGMFVWPPDVFAMAGTILRDTGAYLMAARPFDYTASPTYHLKRWSRIVADAARVWRRLNPNDPSASENLPGIVVELLNKIARRAADGLELQSLTTPDPRRNHEWIPFVQLLAIADESCRGIGLISTTPDESVIRAGAVDYPDDSVITLIGASQLTEQFRRRCGQDGRGAFRPMTLCRQVDPSRAIVLPKTRTSQRGITIRSFSHHLSLFNGCDVEPIWYPCPPDGRPHAESRITQPNDSMSVKENTGPFNLILLPWPFEIAPRQFYPMGEALECLGGRPNRPDAFFRFQHARLDPYWFRAQVEDLIQKAKSIVGKVDGVVLPEMSMRRKDFDRVFPNGKPDGVRFVACGVYEPPVFDRSGAIDKLARNYCLISTMSQDQHGNLQPRLLEQEKHHRWALDTSQVEQYALGSSLGHQRMWWEGIDLPRRSLHFIALDEAIAFTVLICEDLARPDPVADAVRAVGPNLVIALLLDGPQLSSRWSARYATVLADDPGSSVLTLSSLGMVRSSRRRDAIHQESRTVAMWRQPGSSPVELDLPTGSHALLLSLAVCFETERTIDGRHDDGYAAAIRLAGVHALRMREPRD